MRRAKVARRAASSGALALALALASGCRGVEATAPRPSTGGPDYAVYDAVLDGLFSVPDRAGGAPFWVIQDSTRVEAFPSSKPASALPEFGAPYDAVIATLSDDFARQAAVHAALDPSRFHAHGRVASFARETVTGVRSPTTFWQRFYARYPGSRGLISFSRPGYDASGTHALIAYGHGCGSLCGDWGYVLLERQGDRWVVLKRVITAVS